MTFRKQFFLPMGLLLFAAPATATGTYPTIAPAVNSCRRIFAFTVLIPLRTHSAQAEIKQAGLMKSLTDYNDKCNELVAANQLQIRYAKEAKPLSDKMHSALSAFRTALSEVQMRAFALEESAEAIYKGKTNWTQIEAWRGPAQSCKDALKNHTDAIKLTEDSMTKAFQNACPASKQVTR